jgi:ATP-binding cassette subfamily B protein
VAAAWLTKEVLDGIVDGTTSVLIALVVALAVASAMIAALPHLTHYVDAVIGRRLSLAARQRIYAALGRCHGLARFEDPRFHDRLQVAVSDGPHSPHDLVGAGLTILQATVLLTGFAGTLAAVGPWMVPVVLLAAVPTLRAEIAMQRRRAAMLIELGHASRRELFYAELITGVTAAQEVRLFGLGKLFSARMVREMRTIDSAHHRMDRRDLQIQATLAVLGAVAAGAGLVWAAVSARSGWLSVGDVAMFVAAVGGSQAAISSILVAIGQAHRAGLIMDHFRFVAEAEPDLPMPASPVAAPPLRDGIEFRDVWFRYADDLPWVLRGVTLSIPAGRATALVGLNGAGKSTLVKLLCRLYDPTRGSITWDGIDLRSLAVDDLRLRIGAVFQEFMQYELSAAENIGLGDVARFTDRAQVVAAATAAGCHDLIDRLPRGYETMLTRIFGIADHDDQAGVDLSGGQWQRIALARAIIRTGSDLLILDEPSAGLDPEAEHEIHTVLQRHRVDRTSLLISHRLSAVRDADEIVLLADGVVAEHGTHDALLASEGRYYRLFRLQASGYRDG